MRAACAILLIIVAAGCARYEYDLVQPAELKRHIGRNLDQVVMVDPLEYRLRTVDNHLVARIHNRTDDPIRLLGDKSVVVDPEGESHPLRGQTIAANSFIKVIFPPLRPRVYSPGPHFGFGVGVGAGRYHRHPFYHSSSFYYPYYPYSYYHDPFYDPWPYGYYDDYGPRYFYLEDDTGHYWQWRGEGEVRVSFVYQREGQDEENEDAKGEQFRQEFVFRRIKM